MGREANERDLRYWSELAGRPSPRATATATPSTADAAPAPAPAAAAPVPVRRRPRSRRRHFRRHVRRLTRVRPLVTVTSFAERYGPWALIAGGSMGIGAALSHGAAARGLNVVMLAHGEEQLERTAGEVREHHGVEVRTLRADLVDPGVGATVSEATDDLQVGLLVYNATIAPAGRFVDVPLEVHLDSVAVNCATPTALCHLFGRKMVERRRGGIGLVSSMGGTQGASTSAPTEQARPTSGSWPRRSGPRWRITAST